MFTFEVSCKPPDVAQERVHIFRLAPPRVSQKTVLAHARRLGLKASTKAGTLCQDARQIIYSEGSCKIVAHHASGGVRFFDQARWQVDDGTSHVEFDDKTAISMAERFIATHSVVPVADCKVLRVTRLNVGIAEKETGFSEHRVVDVGVVFARVVDGIPVEGPGGKAMVYIDAKGNLTGIDCLWRDVREIHTDHVPLRSPDEVLKEAAREWDIEGSGRVTVDDFRFGYFEQEWDVAQRYLQPVYMLSMTVTATEGEQAGQATMRSGYLGAAAVESPERLMPRRPAASPQAARQRYSTQGL
ncbi:hypothetical protein LJR289_004340 [Pseudoduganella sp. LjRoot289]|uniref:hypothetical protein n=1 Tax=Pseudoduganella sp. LjRoot289 TaxID=3342314 RepID=UPI003ED01797